MWKLDIDLKNLKPPYLIHSDLFRMYKNPWLRSNSNATSGYMSRHLKFLEKNFGVNNLIIPSFNYDFSKKNLYDIELDKSHTGALSNFIMDNNLLKRSKTPIFSFLTNIEELLCTQELPFSCGSTFDYLYNNDGAIVFYGAPISSCTYLHFIEDQFGPPMYRYDKCFSGDVISSNKTERVKVRFHVRPSKLKIDYDWDYLFSLLEAQQVLVKFSPDFFAVRAKDLSMIWGNQFSRDQYSILSFSCRREVTAEIELAGRRFIQKDFELGL